MLQSEGVRKSLAKVTREKMLEHAGQVMAIGMNGEGIIATAPSLMELEQKVANEFGKVRFIIVPGAVKTNKKHTKKRRK